MTLTESAIQQKFVRWFRNAYCLKHHDPRSMILSIPNNRLPGMLETGMMSGAADTLVVYRYMGRAAIAIKRQIWVETKTPEKNSVQSPAQKKFQAHLEQMGEEYVIIRSLDEFKQLILGS